MMNISQRNRNIALDELRGLAILLVWISHFPFAVLIPSLEKIGNTGWVGVELFFVLSGYLVGRQVLLLFERGFSIATVFRFWSSRALRILPPFFAVLALYFLVDGFKEDPTLAPFWKYVTFTFNFQIHLPVAYSVIWSLCIEEHFYLVLPFIVIFLRHKKPKIIGVTIISLIAFSILCRWISWRAMLSETGNAVEEYSYLKWIYCPTYNHFDSLLMGVSLALIELSRPEWLLRFKKLPNSILLFLVLVNGVIASDRLNYTNALFGFPVISLTLALIVQKAIHRTSSFPVIGRTLSQIGRISYSLYLVHKPLMYYTLRTLHSDYGLNLFLSIFLSVAASFLGALALYWCIEFPSMFLRKRWGLAQLTPKL